MDLFAFHLARARAAAKAAAAAVALAAFASALSACESDSAEGEGRAFASAKSGQIVVGEFGAFTGPEGTFGTNAHRGILLATEERNKAGGVKGRLVRVVRLDNQSKPEEAVLAVTRLISRDKALALIGEASSGRTLAAAPIAQKNGVALIAPSATNPKVTEVGDFIFRACFIDPFQGSVMARFAREDLGAKRVAVLRDVKSEYSEGLSKYFVERFKALGGEIVAEELYSAGDLDFKAQLTVIRGRAPDALFIPGYYTDVALIAQQARGLGLRAALLGGDGWESPKLREIGGEAVEGSYFSTHFTPESSDLRVREFVRRFKARFNREPDGLNALAYDSARMVFAAMERSQDLSPRAIRDELAKTRDFPGVTGDVSIDAHRNARKPAVVVKVERGGHRFVRSVAP